MQHLSLYPNHKYEYMYEQFPNEIQKIYINRCLSFYDDHCIVCPSLCDYYNIGFGYAKDHNLTMEEVYDKIFDDLKNEEEIQSGLVNIWNKMANSSGKYKINEFLDPSSNQWIFMEKVDLLFSIVANVSLKMPINFDRSLMEIIGFMGGLEPVKQEELDELHNFFRLPENELNLMTISHLYTMNDFGQFGRSDLFFALNEKYQTNRLSLGGVPTEFEVCFKQMYDEHYNGSNKNVNTRNTFEQMMQEIPPALVRSPCANISQNHPCLSYCQWHKKFFVSNTKRREEFLSLMKLSQPQGKLLMPPLLKAELSLAIKVFGVGNNQSTVKVKESPNIASVPLVIFCKDRMDQNWAGDDDLGLASYCSDFYPTPTDIGICLTKNLNPNNLVSFTKEFERSFPINEGLKSDQLDRLQTKATFILDTHAREYIDSYPMETKVFSRSKKLLSATTTNNMYDRKGKEMKQVFFQIHSTNELPQMIKDSGQDKNMDPITLEAGNEYFVEVTPFGQSVTDQFKLIDQRDRNCLLSTEIVPTSKLKVQTKQNCMY